MTNKEQIKTSKAPGSDADAKAQQHPGYPTASHSPSAGKTPFPLHLSWLAKCSEVELDSLRSLSQPQWFCGSPFPPPGQRGQAGHRAAGLVCLHTCHTLTPKASPAPEGQERLLHALPALPWQAAAQLPEGSKATAPSRTAIVSQTSGSGWERPRWEGRGSSQTACSLTESLS